MLEDYLYDLAAFVMEDGGADKVVEMIEEDNLLGLKLVEKAYEKAKNVEEPSEAELTKLKL